MIITGMDLFPADFPLTVPFTTALHSVSVKKCVLVRLESDEGVSGWGEAAPELEITGDDAKTAFNVLENDLKARLLGSKISDESSFKAVLSSLEPFITRSSTAVAAADIALHDLWCRGQDMPVYKYYHGSKKPLKTSISIGILETQQTLDRIASILSTGGSRIKLKIGRGVEQDYHLIDSVRNRFGNEITLSLDANQGYSVDGALDLFNRISEFEIEYVEQPVAFDDLAGLKRLHNESPIPVMADEAVCSMADLIVMIDYEVCDMVNLKLMKSGGLAMVNRFLGLCAENKIRCQLGCMVETPIGIAAGVHLGLRDRAVHWTDLDGHLFLGDIESCIGGLKTEGDFNIISGGSGLGIDVNVEILGKYL